MRFFRDLGSAKSAEFYRAVAVFGEPYSNRRVNSWTLMLLPKCLFQKEDCTMKKEIIGNRRTFIKSAALFGGLAVLHRF